MLERLWRCVTGRPRDVHLLVRACDARYTKRRATHRSQPRTVDDQGMLHPATEHASVSALLERTLFVAAVSRAVVDAALLERMLSAIPCRRGHRPAQHLPARCSRVVQMLVEHEDRTKSSTSAHRQEGNLPGYWR